MCNPVVESLRARHAGRCMTEDDITVESPVSRAAHRRTSPPSTGEYFRDQEARCHRADVRFTPGGAGNGRQRRHPRARPSSTSSRRSTRSTTQVKMGGIRIHGGRRRRIAGERLRQSFDNYIVAPFRSPVHRLLNRAPRVIDARSSCRPQTDRGLTDAEERVREVMRAPARCNRLADRQLYARNPRVGARVLEQDPEIPRARRRRAPGHRTGRRLRSSS